MMKRIITLFCSIFLLSACSGSGGGTESGDAPLLSAVNDWVYQLQGGEDGIDLDTLGETAFDLVVMDYSSDGSEEGEFTADDIAALKDSGGGAKIVLAYMSIGEAEEGRFYFDEDWVDAGTKEVQPGAPDFLAPSNPDFPDNYKVRYWESEWQDIVFAYLDRIVAAGFDGVYLDIIDAFEYFGPDGELPERPTAGADMIDLVLAIAQRARETDPDFLVFPQNGAAILDEDDSGDYLDTVDGIGAEDTFYFGDEENDNDLDLDHAGEVAPYLDRFVDAGKVVLAIDYVQDPDKVSDFYERAGDRGYLPYASVRDLDRTVVNDGFEPD